jgi:hypothetical protein
LPAFAFVSVVPFRGTFQAYDAGTALSTLLSLQPAIFFVDGLSPADELNPGVPSLGKAEVAR